MKAIVRISAALALLAAATTTTADGLVHTWVDADGVTHFSDRPPADAMTESSTMTMPADFPETVNPDDAYYSIANQWQRVQEERADRERLALERARVRAEQRAASAAPAPPPPPAQQPVFVGGFARPGLQRGFGAPSFPLINPAWGLRGPHPRADRGHGRRDKGFQAPLRQPRHRLGVSGRAAASAGGGAGVQVIRGQASFGIGTR